MYNWYIFNVQKVPEFQLFGNSTMELLGVIDLQNPKCIKRIKQKQLCYAEKSPTVYCLRLQWGIHKAHLHQTYTYILPLEQSCDNPMGMCGAGPISL